MQNITDIINDLEKENKLIDIRNKCTAYVKEANNIKLALDVLYNDIDSDQRFRLEYCSIPDANNNNVYYYRFSIFSLIQYYHLTETFEIWIIMKGNCFLRSRWNFLH